MTYKHSLSRTARQARLFRSILKQAERRLLALDSLPDETLRLLFLSMTPVGRVAAIGHLRNLNDSVGSLYVRYLRIAQSTKLSRMDCTTSHSCFAPSGSECSEPGKTQCYCIMHSSQSHLKL